MPYLIDDEDFQKIGEILDRLIEEKHITIEGRTLLTVLMLVMAQLTKVIDDDLTKASDANLDVEKVAISASPAFASLLKHLSNEYGGVVMGKVNGVPWFFVDEMAPQACGFIPSFLKVEDNRPMKEQFNERYISGWHRFDGFEIKPKNWTISFPGDPDLQPLGGAALHGEVIVVYPYAWVMIIDADNKFEIARMD